MKTAKKSDPKPTWRETYVMTRRAMELLEMQNPKMFLGFTLSAIFQAITPYVTIWFSARLINELAGGRDPKKIWLWVILTILFTAAFGIGGAILERWKNKKSTAWWHGMSKIYADKFMSMDYSVKERHQVNDLYEKIMENGNWSGWGLSYVIWQYESLVKGTLQVLGAIILSVELFLRMVPENGGPLTILNHPLVVFGVILLLCGITILGPVFSTKGTQIWANYAEEATFGNRFFGFFGFQMLENDRAMDARMYEQEKMTLHFWRSNENDIFAPPKKWDHPQNRYGFLKAMSAAVSVVFTGVVYVFVCLKAWAGAFGVGSVTQYVAAITTMSGGMTSVLSSLGALRTNVSFLKLCFEFLDTPNEMYQGSLTTEKRNDRNYEVEFRDVSFRYPGSETYALRHVNMKFKVGQRLAVVGKNGSGKTTFIKLLCRLYDPTEGEILLNGINIRKYRYDDYMGIFSVVFQDFQLLAFPLGQNVAASQEYDKDLVIDCLEKAGFGETLSKWKDGLETYLYKNMKQDGVKISGGEAQKIAIARALYKDAPFIILDEPTAALDPIAEAEIYSKFSEIVGDKTAIYISHRLSSCRFCDEIMVFDHGNVVQQGTHDSLLADETGKYHQLWFAQAQYYQK